MNIKANILLGVIIVIGLFTYSCSSTKFVPEGEYLLSDAKINSDTKKLSEWDLRGHIKQKPNFKTFEIFKVPLSIYNLSGKDSTKWINRTLRRAGEPPVIYDSTQVDETIVQLQRLITNKGYLDGKVTPEVLLKKKKAKVIYHVEGGQPYKIRNYTVNINDSVIRKNDTLSYVPKGILKKHIRKTGSPYFSIDSVLKYNTLASPGSHFNLDNLDQERERIMYTLRRTGYYAMNKDYIRFLADTTAGDHLVDLKLVINPFKLDSKTLDPTTVSHLQYEVAKVDIYVDYNPIEIGSSLENYQVSTYREKDGYRIIYGERGKYIRTSTILEKCFIKPGSLYDEGMTAQTYTAMSQLKILKSVNIHYIEYWEDNRPKLHCVITCVPDKKQGVTTELEGTHSGGFFGLGAGLGYRHKNIFKGSEEFNIGVKGSYEAITPHFSRFSDNYFEIGGQMSVTFPRFMFPFLKKNFRNSIQASTQFSTDYVLQRRPGFFNRTIMSTGVKYFWHDRKNSRTKHTLDLFEVSYIHLPQSKLDSAFVSKLSTAAKRYSFSDHFILSTGYTFSKTNGDLNKNNFKSIYSLRTSIETAGNVLSLIAKVSKAKKNKDGIREVFGTPFSQYIRVTADYSKSHFIDERNSFAWHVGGGIAFPYGNNKMVPIQKRFFSGGANNVRGWAVRELGPGKYYSNKSKKSKENNFYNHSGDIRFDANLEYRSRLFWVIELGAFLDAGNVWTTKSYPEQRGGNFKANRFYKEIAVAWGLGLRLNFDFVLVRLDCGWKAYDPSGNPDKTKWPIKAPHKIKQNTAWHIAVGYPF